MPCYAPFIAPVRESTSLEGRSSAQEADTTRVSRATFYTRTSCSCSRCRHVPTADILSGSAPLPVCSKLSRVRALTLLRC